MKCSRCQNEDVQYLRDGQAPPQTFTVLTEGGTSQEIVVTVTGDSTVDLALLGAGQGFTIGGSGVPLDDHMAGFSVSSAGDVNGDGLDDFIIGAPGGDTGFGDSYVVFGTTTSTDVNLSTLAADGLGFVINGEITNSTNGPLPGQAGWSVSSAGDVNGDGYDDLIIGSPYTYEGNFEAGTAYVVFGSAVPSNVDLDTLGTDGFSLSSGGLYAYTGFSVSSAGDVNGDGFDDILVGAPFETNATGAYAGAAYVVLGNNTGLAGTDIDLSALDTNNSQGFSIIDSATTVNEANGWSVSSAGDVNGDGFADIIIGSPDAGNDYSGFAGYGEAFVIFGRDNTTTPFAQIDLANLASSEGFSISGAGLDEQAGFSVSSAGDVNGDGYDDLIIGEAGSVADSEAGQAYVVFGGDSLSTLNFEPPAGNPEGFTPADGFIISGIPAGLYNISVSSAGDFNGDGYDDIIIGAVDATTGSTDAGQAYLIYGAAGGIGSNNAEGQTVLDLSLLSPNEGFDIQGAVAGDLAGLSVSGAGDVNGDGYDDIIIGAPNADYGVGEAFVLFGGNPSETGNLSTPIVIGTDADDTLNSTAANAVINGGAGNDLINLANTINGFRDIDGGNGTDTLALTGTGQVLDLTTILPAEIQSIEVIDLTGTGNNSLYIDQLAVFDLTEERSNATAVITVNGDAGDVVNFSEAAWITSSTVIVNTVTYDVYLNGDAQVNVEQGVTVTIGPPPAAGKGVTTFVSQDDGNNSLVFNDFVDLSYEQNIDLNVISELTIEDFAVLQTIEAEMPLQFDDMSMPMLLGESIGQQLAVDNAQATAMPDFTYVELPGIVDIWEQTELAADLMFLADIALQTDNIA